MARAEGYKWVFKARFRRNAFGWKSQPAIKRIREAVSEIKKMARRDKVLGAEGAVIFLEKVSPALEHVDSSSGAIGSAVNNAIDALVEIIASAPADQKTREKWLERLFEAHAEDQMPYIELLTDYWGRLCVTPELASRWADKLLDITRLAISPDKEVHGIFHGTSACLSALYTAGRHDELVDLLKEESFWHYRRWGVKALAALGRKDEAISVAESSRNGWSDGNDIDRLCEEMLLSSGLVDDAYSRYGLRANRAGTYLAWFRAVVRKYHHKDPAEILNDLAASTPGEEGKWFAAAKSAQLYDEAIALANRSPGSPQTLTRAARDFEEKNPSFAMEAGMVALRWLVEGYGYDITGRDVYSAYTHTMQAAVNAGCREETFQRIRTLVSGETFEECFVTGVLGRELGLLPGSN